MRHVYWSTLAALLAVLGLAGSAQGLFHDFWPASADGSMALHPDEGYAIAGEGDYRLSKSYYHMAFMAFNGRSDGPDRLADGRVGDQNDGVLLAEWLVGKKAFAASVYLRDMTHSTCDPLGPGSFYFNDPVVIVGFRVANTGRFVDRGMYGHSFTGCCGNYTNPLLEGGENAPPAWRMGPPSALPGQPGYSDVGDIGPGGEYYKLSKADSLHPLGVVNVSSTWFSSNGGGLGGFSTAPGLSGRGRFAFDWIVEKSDAMVVNSGSITTADCSGPFGGDEPRDRAADLIYGEGWFAEHIDRRIVQGLALDPEMKGLVFQSVDAPIVFPGSGGVPGQPWNTYVGGRDQGEGFYGPYLAVTATYQGDVDNDGAVDVVDLLDVAAAWPAESHQPGYNSEADFNCDKSIDLLDLLMLAANWAKTCP